MILRRNLTSLGESREYLSELREQLIYGFMMPTKALRESLEVFGTQQEVYENATSKKVLHFSAPVVKLILFTTSYSKIGKPSLRSSGRTSEIVPDEGEARI